MLSAEDLEFQMVQNHFLKNLPKDSQTEITSVEFVTNPALQQKYEDKKTEFKTNGFPDEEIFAYHGNFANLILERNGILLPKLFWPIVRKNCSSDREKLLTFEAEGREFANFLRSLEQFIQTVKGQINFW